MSARNSGGRIAAAPITTGLVGAPKLTDRVADAIIRQIAEEKMRPGDRLPTIVEMCEFYGVSLTVVREALARLRSEGVVETRQGSGAYVAAAGHVKPFRIVDRGAGDERRVIDVLEMRLGIESEAAALASRRATPTQLQKLHQAFAELEQAVAVGTEAHQQDLNFHRVMVEAANNSVYADFAHFLQQHLEASIGISHARSRLRGVLGTVVQEHAAILDAIAARNPTRARNAARQHLQAGIERLLAILS
ncbi:FadR/GntR family transcriptional regulator [Falsiroseomonas sp. E2-1-a4]|uniref:FadR/GntR family transcriptional regulator n=1 Tax=Falsiroseomonas sp. E2-1-a4 TaxID=3239299 RepID=UPI003F3350E6